MKKQNNRFRNGNNNNNCYTLNYKFDSVSIAGKISGTALDLIRRYNDLAKEAQGCGNYVDMEVYRQYAEHYRKIVTDINERRQARQESQAKAEEIATAEETPAEESIPAENTEQSAEPVEAEPAPNGYVETLPATSELVKTFKVVEISETTNNAPVAEEKPKRTVRRRTTTRKTAEAQA